MKSMIYIPLNTSNQSQININVTFETQKNHTSAGIVRERDSVAPTRVKGF